MDILITAVVFIIILSILVLVHEFGHFYMAKRAGIKVEEFGFGLPPRLWGKKKGETIYSVNWIPFGGFVRMYGEDAHDKKMIKSTRSYVGKSIGARFKVVVAGVVMNFFLAWLLLTIALTVGMRPLLTPEDTLPAIMDGTITLEPGLEIAKVEEGSVAENEGFREGDLVYAFEHKPLNSAVFQNMTEDAAGTYSIWRGEMDLQFVIPEATEDSGITYNNAGVFQALKVYSLERYSPAYLAGVKPGDLILKVDGKNVFSVEDLRREIAVGGSLNYEVYRNGELLHFVVNLPKVGGLIAVDVLDDSPALAGGLRPGDIIRTVNGQEVNSIGELQAMAQSGAELNYMVERDGAALFLNFKPDENGKIGVLLSELQVLEPADYLVLYQQDQVFSIADIKEAKEPWYKAPFVAFGESYRLSVATGRMLLGVFGGFFQGEALPDSVSGPIGIAQMTHVFIQEGFIPLLQFMAVLSLSLAVINILPFPALDGGRLLFIIVEAITGKKANQKFEAYVHALGYILILGLILLVTYHDIVRLLS